MSYNPVLPKGQAVMTESNPVVIASNQSTVPVSLATAPTTPVTGTFWQATQPVSGTVTANAGTGTLAVSLAALPALAAGTANIGDVDVLTLPAVVLTAETTKVIGTVNIAASQTVGLVAGTATIGKVIIAEDHTIVGVYGRASFRTLGIAATPHNLFTIENPAGSSVLIMIHEISVITDSTAVLTSVAPMVQGSRPTGLPTGGTTMTAEKTDTAYPAATAVLRAATASDGGVATAIIATAGNPGTTRQIMRMHTAVGQVLADELVIISPSSHGVLLRAGEAILIQGVVAAAVTTYYIINCMWEEFTV